MSKKISSVKTSSNEVSSVPRISRKMRGCRVRLGRDISEIEANTSVDISQAIRGQSIQVKASPQSYNGFEELGQIGFMPKDVHDMQDHSHNLTRLTGEMRKMAEKE